MVKRGEQIGRGGVKMNDEVIGLLPLAALICNALNGFVTERNVC